MNLQACRACRHPFIDWWVRFVEHNPAAGTSIGIAATVAAGIAGVWLGSGLMEKFRLGLLAFFLVGALTLGLPALDIYWPNS